MTEWRQSSRHRGKAETEDGEGMIFPLKIEPDSKAFINNVDIVFTFQKAYTKTSINITKHDDIRKSMLRFECMQLASKNTDHFESAMYAYDKKHTLYTSKPIENFTHELNYADIPANLSACLGQKNGKLIVTVKNTNDYVDLSDLSQYDSDTVLFSEDYTLRKVLGIIITASAMATGLFSMYYGNELFRLKEEPIVDRRNTPSSVCTRLGTKKGVRIIVKDEICVPAFVLDTKHSPFHASNGIENFLELVLKFVGDPSTAGWKNATTFFNGVKVCPKYEQSRVLQCDGFTKETIENLTVHLQSGGTVPMTQFYAEKGIVLERINVPAMIGSDESGVFPLEVLLVLPLQSVNPEACPLEIRNKIFERNVVNPTVRHNEIMQEMKAMNLQGDITKSFGIHLSNGIEHGSGVFFKHPSKPNLTFGNTENVKPDKEGSFKFGKKYIQPAKIATMALLCTADSRKPAELFLENFIKTGTIRGIQFPKKEEVIQKVIENTGNFEEWEKIFSDLIKRNVKFVLMIGPPTAHYSQKLLKLCESIYKIVTQYVTGEGADNSVKQHWIANILHKTNIKNGGLNYTPSFFGAGTQLDINKEKTLVMSYDVSHPNDLKLTIPQSQGETKTTVTIEFPSVVGLIGNVIKEPSAFVGNFFYQESRKEQMTSGFKNYVLQMLKSWKNFRKLPSTVVILRDGVSETQFSMVRDKELPLIKEACAEIDSEWKPHFLLAILTKRHNKRFFNKNAGNAPVGSFVTHQVVRPDCKEFFMACHKAPQGTAKFIQVSIIYDDFNPTLPQLMSFFHSLAYCHQTMKSPVSLPAPVFQADNIATRGREVLKTLQREKPEKIPITEGEALDFEALSNLLNYSNTTLATKRGNA